QCQSQMRQLGIALHTSQDAYGSMPPQESTYTGWPGVFGNPWTGLDPWGRPLPDNFDGTTQWWILPFIDQANMMIQWAIDPATNTPRAANAYYYTAALPNVPPPKLYLCPSDPSDRNARGMASNNTQPITNYVTNTQVFHSQSPKIPSSMPDGSATTALMFEK